MNYSFLMLLLFFVFTGKAQTVIPLYNSTIPNEKPNKKVEKADTAQDGSIRVSAVTFPTLTLFEADKEKRNGSAVVICPGGGYVRESISKEGYAVAKRLNQMGITCFVLKYRLPDDSTMVDKSIGPLQDAQAAINYVRDNAARWAICSNKIGIMGFSAGGHLASTAGTLFSKSWIPEANRKSIRPDFMILVYPVINLTDSLMHEGSRINLLGKVPSKRKIKRFSTDMQVSKKTPPTFLVHAKDDRTVKVENSLRFYSALQKRKVASELFLYEKGGHGFGLNNPTHEIKWADVLERWLKEGGWLNKTSCL